MRKLALPPTVLLALCTIGLAACGGSGDDSDGTSTFSDDGFPFTFDYPSDWQFSDDVTIDKQLGASGADKNVAVGPDDDNGIIVESYTLNRTVDESNLDDAKAELDRLVAQLDPNASGETGDTGGFPSVTIDAVPLTSPEDGESRLVALFDGEQEYLINCQSTPDKRDEVNQACDEALASLQGN